MKKESEKLGIAATVLLTAAAAVCVTGRLPSGFGEKTAFTAAEFILPAGAADEFFSEDEPDDTISIPVSSSIPSSTPSRPSSKFSSSSAAPVSSKGSSVPASSGTSSAPASSMLDGNILEMCIDRGGIHYQNMYVKNANQKHTIDVGQELAKQPAIKIKKNAGPQVLIYHTHTTEAFYGVTRSTDKSISVCAVGDEIAKQLTAAGIGVVHDTTYHDYPAYNGSYDRSLKTLKRDLKQYPSVQVTLDIHRDAMNRSDGTRLKPTALINGKKAAQIMIISGCDDNGDMGFPNWEYNLRLAVRLQKAMADLYPGLARPLNFCARRYNENVTKGSLLIEIGTDASMLEEAKYSGELFGKALVAVLEKLT